MATKKKERHLPWGVCKVWTEPKSRNWWKHTFEFACDQLRQKVNEEMKETITIYSSSNYTQEELQILAKGGKVERKM